MATFQWITNSGTRPPAAHHSATGVAALAAKKALAATFGVKPEDVEITIRG